MGRLFDIHIKCQKAKTAALKIRIRYHGFRTFFFLIFKEWQEKANLIWFNLYNFWRLSCDNLFDIHESLKTVRQNKMIWNVFIRIEIKQLFISITFSFFLIKIIRWIVTLNTQTKATHIISCLITKLSTYEWFVSPYMSCFLFSLNSRADPCYKYTPIKCPARHAYNFPQNNMYKFLKSILFHD